MHHGTEVIAYYVGIIDFLQFYNCGKKIAHVIKCCDVKPLATVNPTEYGLRFEDYFFKKFKITKTKTPTWLKPGGNISDLESCSGGGGRDGGCSGGGGGGGGGGESGESGETSNGSELAGSQGEGITMSNFTDVIAQDKEESSTPLKVLQGVTMFAAAAGIAAIEMGVLGGPKEEEAER